MSLKTKILIWVGAVLLVAALGFIIYKQFEISSRQEAIEKSNVEQKQLLDGIVRSQNSYTTRDDLEKFIKDNGLNLKTIQEDLKKLNAELQAFNVAVSSSKGQVGTNIPTTPGPGTNPNPVDPTNPDPFGYMKRQQILTLNEDFASVKVPIGTVGFSAWQKDPWDIDIKAREYKASTVVGTDENQRTYVYNKLTVTTDGKEYALPITQSQTQQVYPESKMSWFNPRLYLGVDGFVGVNPVKGEFAPSLTVQIMSYGRYKTQPDLSILQVGAGFGIVSRRPQITVTPISYNVGKHIPLMNNLYIGPTLGVSTDGNVLLGGGIKVGL